MNEKVLLQVTVHQYTLQQIRSQVKRLAGENATTHPSRKDVHVHILMIHKTGFKFGIFI